MPKIGVSGPWLAEYNNINGVISYTNGLKLARMVSFSAEPDGKNDGNDFHSDNGISETDRGMSTGSGSITESVDHYDSVGSKRILNLKENTLEVDGKPVTELVYDKTVNPGYWGHGIIIKKRKSGKDLWRAVVYTKTMYSIPGDAAETQGESINWQAEELKATYMRDDSIDGRWKREATFETEKQAVRYIETVLNILPLGELKITSKAGTEIGSTKITVTPALESGNKYKYIVAPEVGLPAFDQTIGVEYIDWDGTKDIKATGGHQILVVEVDDQNKAKKAGIATIVVSEG